MDFSPFLGVSWQQDRATLSLGLGLPVSSNTSKLNLAEYKTFNLCREQHQVIWHGGKVIDAHHAFTRVFWTVRLSRLIWKCTEIQKRSQTISIYSKQELETVDSDPRWCHKCKIAMFISWVLLIHFNKEGRACLLSLFMSTGESRTNGLYINTVWPMGWSRGFQIIRRWVKSKKHSNVVVVCSSVTYSQ